MKVIYFKKKIIVLFLLFLTLAPLFSYGQEQRLIPISYKSCDSRENKDYSVKNLWDNNTDAKHKWYCFHAGYTTPQTHWVVMDLGAIYPINRIVVLNEGNEQSQLNLLTEDFKLFGSDISMTGPWFIIKDIVDNMQKVNTFELPGIKLRYLGLEVTDPQVGAGPNKTQDDWAVRISELYIYTEPPLNTLPADISTSPPSPFDISSVIPTATSPPVQTPLETGSSFPDNVIALINKETSNKTGKKLLYFYNPNVVKCKNMEAYFTIPKVIEALKPYYFEPVRSSSNEPRLTQYSIYIVPTLIITDSQGTILKRTSNAISTEEEMIKFLE